MFSAQKCLYRDDIGVENDKHSSIIKYHKLNINFIVIIKISHWRVNDLHYYTMMNKKWKLFSDQVFCVSALTRAYQFFLLISIFSNLERYMYLWIILELMCLVEFLLKSFNQLTVARSLNCAHSFVSSKSNKSNKI